MKVQQVNIRKNSEPNFGIIIEPPPKTVSGALSAISDHFTPKDASYFLGPLFESLTAKQAQELLKAIESANTASVIIRRPNVNLLNFVEGGKSTAKLDILSSPCLNQGYSSRKMPQVILDKVFTPLMDFFNGLPRLAARSNEKQSAVATEAKEMPNKLLKALGLPTI